VRTRLIAATLALAATPVGVAVSVAAAPAATAAEACTPTITMNKPFQDAGGMAVFQATFSVCDQSRVTIKVRDRDDPNGGWGAGSGTWPAGTSTTTWTSVCNPDGKAHRWVAYATIKTPTGGTLLAQTAKVYIKSKPVTGTCAPWFPPGA
jgi:hypothetical protein